MQHHFAIDDNVWIIVHAPIPPDDQTKVISYNECQSEAIDWLKSFVKEESYFVVLDEEMFTKFGQRVLKGSQTPSTATEVYIAVITQERYKLVSFKRDGNGIAVLPEGLILEGLNDDDYQFVAAALAVQPPAMVVNAVDGDWHKCRAALEAVSVTILELCPAYSAAPQR